MQTISIVIPTKNEEDFLPLLLTSLRNQTLQPQQIIVADAHSTDHTRAIAQEAGAVVVDGGMPGPGRNLGARHATSDVILFLDADVTLPQADFLEKAVEEFSRRHLDIATTDVSLPDGKGYDKVTHELYNKYARLLGSALPHAPGFCIFVTRVMHERIGGFDETVQFCEDHDYAHRASKLGSFGFLDSVKIAVTTRRQERDGRVNMAVKYLLAELHLLLFGPIRHDKFRYGFGYPSDVVKKVKEKKNTF